MAAWAPGQPVRILLLRYHPPASHGAQLRPQNWEQMGSFEGLPPICVENRSIFIQGAHSREEISYLKGKFIKI